MGSKENRPAAAVAVLFWTLPVVAGRLKIWGKAMAITLPSGLPARTVLEREGVPLRRSSAAEDLKQPTVRILLLNLMPEKARTEIQIARVLGKASFSVELTLAIPDGYAPKTTAPGHIAAFYRPWSALDGEKFDGMIITGAPVETLPFEAVSYWSQLVEIFEWSRTNVRRSYLICWAAQAALYHFHGVPKHLLSEKLFGVFEQRVVAPKASVLRGFGDSFPVPVSRYAETRAEDLPGDGSVKVLATSSKAGLCLLEEHRQKRIYMFNHLEYDAETLQDEYRRDLALGRPIALPKNYFPADDPARRPVNRWQAHGLALYRNWLGEVAATSEKAPAAQPDGSFELVPCTSP